MIDEKLPWIDALRGYAVLAVLAIHSQFAMFGNRGVQLFFFASAFTLLASMARRREPVLHFYVRRFFRIAPMFYLALAFYSVTRGALQSVPATMSFLFALTPWTIWSAVPGGWSVGEEWLFYLLLPTAARCISTPWRSILVLVILAIGGHVLFSPVLNALAPVGTSTEFWRVSVAMWANIPLFFTAFAAGMVLFRLREAAIYRWMQQGAAWRHETMLLAALAFLGWRLVRLPDHIIPIVVSFIPIGLALSLGAGRWLVTTPIRYVGRISYSCYLVHWTFLESAEHLARGLGLSGITAAAATFVFVTVLTVAASSITFRLIERPGIRLGEAIIRRLKQRTAPPAVETARLA